MTAPLTPSDCDLQDFPFMPLHVARLRDSDLAAEEHPEACWYAVMLWSAAWHQLPAGSLPDNETVLARLCGLGRDLKTFRKHRAGAMRGFVLCEDGRLYHPVIAEQAIAAWEGKKQQRWRSECARIKKSNQRNGTSLPAPTYDQFLAGTSPSQSGSGPDNVPEDRPDCPEGHDVQEKGTGTGTGKDIDTPQPPQGGRRKPKVALPADFPTDELITEQQAKAREVGANFDVQRFAARFRDQCIAKDHRYADWPAAWRNWCRTEIDRAPKTPMAALATRPAQAEDDRWRRWLREFRQNGHWPSDDAGPRPGHPACRVPPAILAEFGFTPPTANDPTDLFAQGAAA